MLVNTRWALALMASSRLWSNDVYAAELTRMTELFAKPRIVSTIEYVGDPVANTLYSADPPTSGHIFEPHPDVLMKVVVEYYQFIGIKGGKIGRCHGDTATMAYHLK